MTVKTNSISLTVDPGNSCSSGAEGILNVPGYPNPIPMKFISLQVPTSTPRSAIDHNSVLTVCSGQYKGTYTSNASNDAFSQTQDGYLIYYTNYSSFAMESINPVEL